MALQQPDRLKSQLLTSGLQQKDPALYQIINSLIDIIRAANLEITSVAASSGGTDTGITELTGDVAAGPGSGSQVATIQPDAVTTPKIIDDAITTPKILDNNVTYAKIQQVSATQKLLGNDEAAAPANVREIGLGENLSIEDNTLQITPSGGTTTGLGHRVLSDTHIDSLPATPVLNDIIYAGEGEAFVGTFVNAALVGQIQEDCYQIRAAYMLGFSGNELELAGNVGCMAPPPLDFVTVEVPEQWLTWDLISGYLLGLIIEDFYGIRGAYQLHFQGQSEFPVGNVGVLAAYPTDMITPPDPAYDTVLPAWQRKAIGAEGTVLGVLNGALEYLEDLDVPGNINADTGNITAGGNVTGGALIGLASVSAPLVNGVYLGIWIDVPFDAANFTANGGTTPTWTLVSGDQVLFRYCYISPEMMIVQVYLATTSVASAAGNVTDLMILIPDGKSAVGTVAQLCGAQEAGAAVFDIYCGTDPATDATKIFIRTYPIGSGRAFDQTPNGSYFGFTIILEVA